MLASENKIQFYTLKASGRSFTQTKKSKKIMGYIVGLLLVSNRMR